MGENSIAAGAVFKGLLYFTSAQRGVSPFAAGEFHGVIYCPAVDSWSPYSPS
jgi:hypothetical protein